MEGNDWVVLYSDKQDAYHVERSGEYKRKGPTNGNWQIVDGPTTWQAAFAIVGQRREQQLDQPRRQ